MTTHFDADAENSAPNWERNPLTAFYPLIRQRMTQLTPNRWPDLAREIERHVTILDLPPAVLLPIATCAAAGGPPQRAVSSAAAVGFILLCARWLDDAVDQDRPDGLWATVGPGRSTLFGASALALAFQSVAGDPNTPREVGAALARYSVAMARGQDIDLTGKARSLDEYWELMRGKTGAGFALACEVGAICAGAEIAVAQAFAEVGMHLGVLLQILDDLEGSFRPTGTGDLRQGKVTLPVVYALAIDHARRNELKLLVESGDLGQHSVRATEILKSAGAREYAVWAALKERNRAMEIINRLSRPGDETTDAGQTALTSFVVLPFHGLPELRERFSDFENDL